MEWASYQISCTRQSISLTCTLIWIIQHSIDRVRFTPSHCVCLWSMIIKRVMRHCEGEDFEHPKNASCAQAMNNFQGSHSWFMLVALCSRVLADKLKWQLSASLQVLHNEISGPHILYDKCIYVSPRPNNGTAYRKNLMEESGVLDNPPPRPGINCMVSCWPVSYIIQCPA